MSWYEASVVFETEVGDGKIKNITRRYIVEAESITEANINTETYLAGALDSYDVTGMKLLKIEDYIDPAAIKQNQKINATISSL